MSSPASDQLFARALQLIPGGVNSPVRAFRSVVGAPFFVKAARGATLITADDRELIDFVCTWGPAIHGHNHPRIKAAIAAALENGTSFGTPNPYEVEMAELIVKFVPSIQKVRMCNSGTEATMSAIRLARGFTKRDKIIKFSGCYHGHSDSLLIKAGSGALTHGNPDSAGVPASFARETVVLPYNDRAALDAGFAANPGQIACVIIEPFCGNVGFIMPDAGYLAYLREITAKHGTLLIFDEVMTGFRIAKGGVQEREKITPDLTCLGKSSAVAYPSAPSAAVPISWITSRRSVPFTKPARSAAIRSPWRPVSPRFVCSKNKIPTPGSTPSAASSATPSSPRAARRASPRRCRSAARCSASSSPPRRSATMRPPSPATRNSSRGSSTLA